MEQISLRNVRAMQVNREELDAVLNARLKQIEDSMMRMKYEIGSKTLEWSKVCTYLVSGRRMIKSSCFQIHAASVGIRTAVLVILSGCDRYNHMHGVSLPLVLCGFVLCVSFVLAC